MSLPALLAAIVLVAADDRDLPASAREFLSDQCVSCHDARTRKGGLDLSSLKFDPDDRALSAKWIALHDRVRDGEMPPKSAGDLDPDERRAFLGALGEPLASADLGRTKAVGRSVWRRLNRYEYENSLRDLLDAPWLQVRDQLPEDGEAYRFNKSGEALSISHVQMARYLGAAEYAFREATASRAAKPESKTTRYYAREQPYLIGHMKFGPFNMSPERATFPLLDFEAQPDVIAEKVPVSVGESDPETREREAFGVVASSYEPIEPRFNKFRAPMTGRYKLRFSAYSFWAGPGKKPRWWVPDRNVASKGRTVEPVTVSAQASPLPQRMLGRFDVNPEPGVYEIEAWLIQGETILVDAARLFRSRPSGWHNPLATEEGCPGVAYRWLEVEGPIFDRWPPQGHQALFGDLPLRAGPNGKATVVSENPEGDARRLLASFLARAYRHPAPEGEADRFLPVVKAALADGSGFAEAMYAGYAAILCSPEFVGLAESPGRLDDHALASRLSYFLWNSPPDGELRGLADAGKLQDPAELRKQVDRLLDEPKSQRFREAFLDYWLDLRKIGVASADEFLYPDYYLDDLLLDSALEETRAYFAEMIRANLPARNVVASDFAMINDRLAELYGLPQPGGSAIRKVPLPPDSPRGGLMTQASVLKVTANGVTTSPVLRGVWIQERIIGKPLPTPPPGVPGIEPDIRGATTIREQLAKHRALPACAGCHAKSDPPGFALESFDVFGGRRDHYRALSDKDWKPGYGKNGQPFKFRDGLPVDCSGDLADGRKFDDVRELKQLFLADEPPDRPQPAQPIAHLRHRHPDPLRRPRRGRADPRCDLGRRLRDPLPIHALVQSDLFRSK
ncbi:MAG: DUF1592 domain-containing protein [Isosphaeraceae bacterium]